LDGEGSSKAAFGKFLELARAEVADAATFEPAGATVIQPRAHAAAVVRKVVGQIVRPVHAQVIHEERVDVEVANLYFHPVYSFELLWKSKNKRVDVDLDGLTGEIQTEGAGRLSLGGLSWPR
jgi:hypothetical protein